MRRFQAFLALAGAALVICAAVSAHPAGGAYSLVLQPNGKIVAAGWGQRGSQVAIGLARYTPGGSLDKGFGLRGQAVTPFGQRSGAYSAALQADGKVVTAGFTGRAFSSSYRFGLARYAPNGALDHSFGTKGHISTKIGSGGAVANGVTVQADRKIVAVGLVGALDRFIVARYLPGGKLDTSFGTGGIAQTALGSNAVASAVAPQPDGKIVVSGTAGDDFVLVRYQSDGSLDPAFGTNGVVKTSLASPADARAIALQPDGKIVVAGDVETDSVGPGYRFALARYLPDGSLDPSFGSSGIVTTPFGNVIAADLPFGGAAGAVAIQTDGKIVAGGTLFVPWPGRGSFAIARYNADGSLDSSFGDGGRVTSSFGYAPPENPTEAGDFVAGLALQPDGKVVAGGFSQFGPHTEQYAVAVARYLSDGSLDQSFGTGGLVKTSLALCVVPKLRGQRMDWFAQQRIKGSHCAVGKIKRVHSRRVKRRHIISERPRPGTVHVEGTKVRVVVSLGRR
jgi:uncharacterized delta-60 repeat protein